MMRLKFTVLFIFIFQIKPANLLAQAPQAIPFQAVARDNSGNILANQAVSIRFTIHDGSAIGAIVYKEVQNAVTNILGLFSLNIGNGTPVTGTFSTINWSSGSKFTQIEIDPSGGGSYTDLGTQQMMSVPFALNAASGGTPVNIFSGAGINVSGGYPNYTITATGGTSSWNQKGPNIYYTAGKVGIGLNVPAQKLDVLGNINVYVNSSYYQNGVPLLSSYQPQRNFVLGTNQTVLFNGNDNCFIGDSSGISNQGGQNIAIGNSCMAKNQGGFDNTALGIRALYRNNFGSHNVSVGSGALYTNFSGSFNTAVGTSSMFGNVNGSDNVSIGFGALQGNVSGSNNTALGDFADVSNSNLSNATAVGHFAIATASNSVLIGGAGVTVVGGPAGWSNFSDGRFKSGIRQDVPGLSFITKLKPVTYHFEVNKYERFTGVPDSEIEKHKETNEFAEKIIRSGFIAQEVEKAAQEAGYDFDGINKPQNEKDHYSIVYSDFVPSLVKSVQELSQSVSSRDALVSNLKTQNEELKQRIEKVESELSQVKAILLSK